MNYVLSECTASTFGNVYANYLLGVDSRCDNDCAEATLIVAALFSPRDGM